MHETKLNIEALRVGFVSDWSVIKTYCIIRAGTEIQPLSTDTEKEIMAYYESHCSY
jgi:hypothetical protein